MPMKLPLAYLDATFLEEVPLPLWRDVFDAVGWLSSLEGKKQSFTHTDLLEAFAADAPTEELLEAMEALHVFGSEVGRNAVATALADCHAASDALPAGLGERELALQLFLRPRSDAVLAEVFIRAQAHATEHGARRTYHDFMGREAGTVFDPAAKCRALEAATLEHSRANDLGEYVQVRAFNDDGVFVFHVIRSSHTRKPLAVTPRGNTRATIEYRPVHSDLVKYDESVGMLRIASRAPSVIEFYRRVLGQVLFGEEDYFSADNVCSLTPLQDRGRALLDQHNVVGVGRVRLTEFLWERGDRSVVQVRSPDCYQQIEELRLPFTEGRLLQAKLKLDVIGKSTRPVTIAIRAPSRFDVSKRQHDELAERFLRAIGIVGGASNSAAPELWTLHPWRHPVAVWRRLFGRDTDALVAAHVLVPIQLDAVESPEHSAAGRVLHPHPIGDNDYYGVSTDPEVPSRSLSATDLDGLALDPERFRQELRTRLQLSGPAAAWDERAHALDLGVADFGEVKFRLGYAIRPPDSAVEQLMTSAAAGDSYVTLIPSPTRAPAPREAVLPQALPARADAIRRALVVSGLVARVPAIHIAPSGTRLVVDRMRGMVWIDQIHIEGLRPGTQPFRFVEHMAQANGDVSTQDLSNMLSGARDDGNLAARQAKRAVKGAISSAMDARDLPFVEDPFPAGATGTYRCALPAFVSQ